LRNNQIRNTVQGVKTTFFFQRFCFSDAAIFVTKLLVEASSLKICTAATYDQQAGRQVAELQQNSAAGSSTHGAPTGRREHHVQQEEERASAAAAGLSGLFCCTVQLKHTWGGN
jgi:hypothetical protein